VLELEGCFAYLKIIVGNETMTLLTGVTPSPAQLARAYKDTFTDPITYAGGRDGRISRAAAKKIQSKGGVDSLIADNVLNYLAATGQKSVSSKKFLDVVCTYAGRTAAKVAGTNQRLSLAEIRKMPVDLRSDIRYLRGQGPLAPKAPRLKFEEDEIYPFLLQWQATHTLHPTTITHDGNQVVTTGLSPMPSNLRPLVDDVMETLWEKHFIHQSTNDTPLDISASGSLYLGNVINDDDGQMYMMAYWKDRDDASLALFFKRDAQGQWVKTQTFPMG
jgi:hypothetical protein